MIEITTETFAGIECLHAAPAGKHQTALPVVLFYHGFTSSKEVYAYFAVALAQAGFRAIMPDADLHGRRYNGDTAYRLTHFWEIVKSNIDEMMLIEAVLRDRGLIAEGRLAVAGASMGGMTALGAMTRYPQINSVACLMGSGYFMSLSQSLFPPRVVQTSEQQETFRARMAPLEPYDVTHQLEKLADRPLLLWHGEADDVVPFAESERLHQALCDAGLDKRLTWLTEKGIGHKITPSALDAFIAFFLEHL